MPPTTEEALRELTGAIRNMERLLVKLNGPRRPGDLNKHEVAAALGVSARTVARYMDAGILGPGKMRGNRRVWSAMEVEAARGRLEGP